MTCKLNLVDMKLTLTDFCWRVTKHSRSVWLQNPGNKLSTVSYTLAENVANVWEITNNLSHPGFAAASFWRALQLVNRSPFVKVSRPFHFLFTGYKNFNEFANKIDASLKIQDSSNWSTQDFIANSCLPCSSHHTCQDGYLFALMWFHHKLEVVVVK